MIGKWVLAPAIVSCAVVLCLASVLQKSQPEAKLAPQIAAAAVEIQMKNVDYLIAQNVGLEIRVLRGRLRRTNAGRPVTLDDIESFVLQIDSAEIAITAESLSQLLNSYVFAYPSAPIKDVRVTFKGSRVTERGTLHKGVDIPFEIEGGVAATPAGEISLHADTIKAAHVPVKGFLHLFGLNLSKLLNDHASSGLRVEGNDVVLSPARLLPPPRLEGRIARVWLEEDKLVQLFDSGRRTPALRPPLDSDSYIYHRGGVLRFGKLTMEDADLEIVGDGKRVPFTFFLREYKKQLMAGYSKNTAGDGLVVHMADYRRLQESEKH